MGDKVEEKSKKDLTANAKKRQEKNLKQKLLVKNMTENER